MTTLTPIVPGPIDAPVLKLDAPISFWGGVDYQTGTIIDQSHPQKGEPVGGKCLIVSMVRGSGGTPGNLAMILKLGLGPAGIVIGYPDINVMTGIAVAKRLYNVDCPMFLADEGQLKALGDAVTLHVSSDGTWQKNTGCQITCAPPS